MTSSTLLWVTRFFSSLPLLFLILPILGAECKQPQLSLQTCILMKRCASRGDVNPVLPQPDNSVWRRQRRAGDWTEAYTRQRRRHKSASTGKVSDAAPAAASYTSFTHLKWLFFPSVCTQAQFPLRLSAYFKAVISLSVTVSFACITIFVRVYRTSTLLPARRMLGVSLINFIVSNVISKQNRVLSRVISAASWEKKKKKTGRNCVDVSFLVWSSLSFQAWSRNLQLENWQVKNWLPLRMRRSLIRWWANNLWLSVEGKQNWIVAKYEYNFKVLVLCFWLISALSD